MIACAAWKLDHLADLHRVVRSRRNGKALSGLHKIHEIENAPCDPCLEYRLQSGIYFPPKGPTKVGTLNAVISNPVCQESGEELVYDLYIRLMRYKSVGCGRHPKKQRVGSDLAVDVYNECCA